MSTEAGPSAATTSSAAKAAAGAEAEEEGTAMPKVDLLESYREQVASGRLKWDDEQVRVVMRVSLGEGSCRT